MNVSRYDAGAFGRRPLALATIEEGEIDPAFEGEICAGGADNPGPADEKDFHGFKCVGSG